MRKQIEALIENKGICRKVSADTGMPLNTVRRIFTGEAKIDNITLKNAETLANYYAKAHQNKDKIIMTIESSQFVELLDYYVTKLIDDDFVGVDVLRISKYTATFSGDSEVDVYAVEIEEFHELFKRSKGKNVAYDILVDNISYEDGDVTPVRFFETEEQAAAFANAYYPQIDVSEEIEKIYMR